MFKITGKKFFMNAALAAAVFFSACSEQPAEQSETLPESVTTVSGTVADAEEASAAVSGEDGLTAPLTADPESAVKVYLQKLSESENVTAAELRDTRISQTGAIAYKYYESPLAEKFGVAEDVHMIPVNVDYCIEYAENSGLQSGEKSEYFIVKSDENGFAVVDVFAHEPKEYYGEIKEVLTDEGFHGKHYLVELDGGFGTVECNNVAFFDGFEAGERVKIYGNGDPPRVDAVSIVPESEASDGE